MLRIIPYLLLLFACPSFAQRDWCISQSTSKESIQAYQQMLSKLQSSNSNIHSRSVRDVQVVVHVVAREGYQPVSVAQVLHQLDILNADFASHGENFHKLPSAFQQLAEDAQIHFCLAHADPQGQPTSGITFTQTSELYFADAIGEGGRKKIHFDELGGKTGWDTDRYINIWVGEFFDHLGFAAMPGEANYPEETGIVIDIRHFGSIGDAGYYNAFGRGHTLTHEMGHYLGLKHIWGDGLSESCNDSDDIDDTPNQGGPYYGCPDGEQLSCGVSNMYQNFMDLTNDFCLAAFTHDQTERMNAVLDLFYPNLDKQTTCNMPLSSFNNWYSALTWASDPGSDKMVVYQQDGFVGERFVRVFSIDGKQVFSKIWRDEHAFLIDLNQVASGVYLINISFGSENQTRKIIVY